MAIKNSAGALNANIKKGGSAERKEGVRALSADGRNGLSAVVLGWGSYSSPLFLIAVITNFLRSDGQKSHGTMIFFSCSRERKKINNRIKTMSIKGY